MLRRLWRPETGIFLGLWLLLMIGGQSRLLLDPGTFWHTVVGRQLLASHHFLTTDPFSFTFGGQRWIPYEWLGECCMALVHDRLDGLDALLLVTVTLLAGLYTWAAHRLIRSGLHWSLAVALLALALGASTNHFHVRPHIGTILLLGCTFALLSDFEAGRIRLARLFWLVPLFVVWTNLHGGMLGGLGTLGLAWAGWSFARLVGADTPLASYRQVAACGLLVLACGLTALVTPYGWQLPEVWLELMGSKILPQIIVEHAPLNPLKVDGLMVLLFGAAYLIALLGTLPGKGDRTRDFRGPVPFSGQRGPRITWLLPLVWFVLACTRIRHAPLFAITALVALADILPQTRYAAWMARHGSDLFQFPSKEADGARRWDWRPALLPALVVLLTGALQLAGVRVPVVGHGWARLDPTHWPVDLLPALERCQDRRPNGTPIFNEYGYGGFLIYFTPGFRVFVDDRCEVYGDQWLLEFVEAEQGNQTAEHMAEWQRRYGVFDFALTRSSTAENDLPFDAYFRNSPGWEVVQRTPTATLYRRKNGTGASG